MFDQATADAICERISAGEPMSRVCTAHKIGYRTVFRWIEEQPEFAAAIAHAREIGGDAIADEAFEIADNGNLDDTQRAKLRVDTRLKLLAKWNPRKYGDRSELALTGANGSDLFASLGKAELLAELSRRMSSPELQRALQALPGVASGALALPKPKP